MAEIVRIENTGDGVRGSLEIGKDGINIFDGRDKDQLCGLLVRIEEIINKLPDGAVRDGYRQALVNTLNRLESPRAVLERLKRAIDVHREEGESGGRGENVEEEVPFRRPSVANNHEATERAIYDVEEAVEKDPRTSVASSGAKN